MINKRCIVHVPFKIDHNRPSGPNIRPLKMIKSFENMGFEVSVIEGDSKSRKTQIASLVKDIINKVEFDFVYSESSTMPTLLTDHDHVPRYFNMDYSFLKICRNNGIPVSLFYRDVYWKYPEYKNGVSKLKYIIGTFFYNYDLYQYNKSIDLLYTPSPGYLDKIKGKINIETSTLPPGYDRNPLISESFEYDNSSLRLFYVGGINTMYDLLETFKVVSKLPKVNLKVVTRLSDWVENKHLYVPYMCNGNIEVTHESGLGIEKYYEWADLLVLTTKPNEYREMAVPIKLFEYIGNKKPIISYGNSFTGNYIMENNIGYTINYGTNDLEQLLQDLIVNKDELSSFKSNLVRLSEKNTWLERSRKVVHDMKKINKNKVLILSDASNSHTRKWVKQTQEEGYEVVVVSLNPGTIDNCKVYDFSESNQLHRSNLSKLSYLKHLRKLKSIIKFESPDIIHAHFASSYGLLAMLTGEPYFLNVWGRDVYTFPKMNFITKNILKLVLSNSRKIYSTSIVMKNVTQEYTKKEITVTPFGVEIDVFSPNTDKDQDANTFHIGYIKLIEKKYGIEDLIDSFVIINDKYPEINFHLTIVGKGTLKSYLEQKVIELNIHRLVTFIDYVNGQEKISELYNTFDTCVFASIEDSESFGVSAVESMATGTPTIVSDVSGFKEISKNGEIALMFTRGNVSELTSLLEHLLLNPHIRQELSIKSRNHVVKMYNVKDNFQPVFQDYIDFLNL